MSARPAPLLAPGAAAPPAYLRTYGRRALVAGVVGLVALAAGGIADKPQLFRSWLPAYMLWLGVALGSLAVLMLGHLTRGTWAVVTRRPLEAAARTLPFVALGLIPLVVGETTLYPWSRPEAVAASRMLQHQRSWMNPDAVLFRAVVFFAVWTALAWSLDRMSRHQDEAPDPRLLARLQSVAAPGLIFYGFSVTFFGVDWLMSVNAEWYSSIFGFYMMGSQGLSAYAFCLVAIWLMVREGTLENVWQPRHLHDVGKLLFAFLLVWAYFSVSQLIIIWSGNLPGEISWYYVRMGGAWKALSIVVVLLHFVLPFGLLLSADLKKNARLLGPVALFLVLMRWLDLYWQAAPALSPKRFTFHWLDVAALVGIGGVWAWLFFWQLQRRALVPLHDPYLTETLEHHG